jgi:hypothetical protein
VYQIQNSKNSQDKKAFMEFKTRPIIIGITIDINRIIIFSDLFNGYETPH